MIEKHLTLSSYTLEHPFTADYSHFQEEIVDLIDKNNDVYEFRLADTELYEVGMT